MKDKPIIETNKLIARFMGLSFDPVKKDGSPFYTSKEKDGWVSKSYCNPLYHSSWDWLMPVVQKILNAPMDTFDSYALWVSDSLRTADISQVYGAVINFLEQDNPRY